MTTENQHLKGQIPLYINGALKGDSRLSFEQALKQNPELKQEYKDFYEIDSLFEMSEDIPELHLEQLFNKIQVSVHSIPSSTQTTKPSETSDKQATKTVDENADIQDLHLDKELVDDSKEDHSSPLFSKESIYDLFLSPRISWGIIIAQFIILISLLFLPSAGETPNGTALGVKPINVVFADNATQKEIRELLVSFDAQIANGPTSVGLYTIYVKGDQSNAEDVVDKLKKSKLILLAEPAFI